MDKNIIGLIPAAGKGMRLGLPYPKELYPVIRENRYKPISQFILTNMVTAGVEHVVFVINETKHQLIGYFGDGHRFGCNISYVVQEPLVGEDKSTSPGLAHALDSAYHLIKGKSVYFGMADTIMQPTQVFALATEAMAQDDDMLLILFDTDHPEKFGMVVADDHNRVTNIIDKPKKTDLKEMWGCMVWRARFTEFLHTCVTQKKIYDFARIMNDAISDGMRFRGYHVDNGVYIDLGTYDEIMEFDHRFRES